MSDPTCLVDELQAHLAACEELLRLAEREHQSLQAPEPFPVAEFHQQREQLLPALTRSLGALQGHRQDGLQQPPGMRRHGPGVAQLIRRTQDVILKTLMLDRDNEQLCLRRGLVPPARLPAPARQRPHFVTDLYRRHSSA